MLTRSKLVEFLHSNKINAFVIFLVVFMVGNYALSQHLRPLNISIIFILIFLGYFFQKDFKWIKPSLSLILFCSVSFVGVTLLNHFSGRLDGIPDHLFKTYRNIINQYIWFLPLLLLPSIFYKSKFKVEYLINSITFVLVFLMFYLFYWGHKLNYGRSALADFFNPIITYDIGLISLSILVLIYAFFIKNNKSYFYLIVSLLCIFLLIMHGSRGTWVGLPAVFLLIGGVYFKTQLKKVLLMYALVFLFVTVNLINPESALVNRIDEFKTDTQELKQQNYQTSSGLRLYMWENSIEIFKQHPITGIGMYEIEHYNCELEKKGLLPQCFQHMHSIYFHELAANGLIGILSLLLTFGVALFYFLRNFFNVKRDREIKNLSLMGFTFVSYYMACGLTEYYLFFYSTTYFFYLFTASIMVLIALRNRSIRLG